MSGPTLATLALRVDASKAISDVRAFGNASDRAATQTTLLERSAVALGGAFAAYKLAQYARDTLLLADSYTNLQARLGLVTAGVENLTKVERQLFQVSQDTRTGLEANVALYASLARSTKALGLEQAQLVGITETVSQALVLSGAGASEANAAIRQLSQGLASGVLRGDEFNSIMENAPVLQQAMAAALGVSNGQLRAMAEQGKLTTQLMASTLLKIAPAISAEFTKMPITVAGAMTQLRNSLLAYVGAGDQAAGVSHTIAESISLLARNLATLAQSVIVIAGVMAGRWLASFAAAHAQQVEMYAQVARGNAVLLGSVTAQRGAAAAAVEHAQTQRAASAQVIASLQAEQAQLLATKAAARTAFSTASGRVEQATSARTLTGIDPSVRDVAGGQAAAQRELTAAYAARTAAQQTLTASSQRMAATDAELIAASNTLAVAEGRVTAAETARAAVMLRTSLVTRAATATTTALGQAMALVGGPIGVVILAAYALYTQLDKLVGVYSRLRYGITEQTDAQKAATEAALDAAHKRAAAQKQAADAQTQAQLAFQALKEQRTEELGKLAALNGGYRQSAVELKLLEIRYDANIQRAQNAKAHRGAELVTLNALTDGIARQKAAQVLLADQLDRENRLRATQRSNLEAIRAAQQDAELSGMSGDFAARRKAALDQENALLAARLDFAEKTRSATANQTATAQAEYASTVKRINAEHVLRDSVLDTREAMRLKADAGETAVAEMKQTLELAKKLRDDMDAPLKNFAENIQRTMGDAWTRVFEDGVKAFSNVVDIARGLMSRLAGEMVALFAAKRLTPALMSMLGMGGSGKNAIVRNPGDTNYLGGLGGQMASSAAMSAAAGGFAGYSVGSSTTNRGSGTLFGAASGAAAGAMMGSIVPGLGTAIGAIIGGLAGAIGGFFGASKAAKEAEKSMWALQKSLATSIEAIKAQISGDGLGVALAQTKAQFDALRQATEDAYAGGKNERQRGVILRELDTLQAQVNQKLREEAVAKERLLAISTKQNENDALAARMATARTLAESARQTAGGLSDYSRSLTASLASPGAALGMSRADFDALAARARGGDRAAADQLPAVAQAFLAASRDYNASSAAYVQDVRTVQGVVDEIAKQYVDQATIQEQILATLTAQQQLIAAQLQQLKDAENKRANDAERALAAAAYTAAAATGNTAGMIAAIERQRVAGVASADLLLSDLEQLRGTFSQTGQGIIDAQTLAILENRNAVATAANTQIAAIQAGATVQELAQLAQITALEQARLDANVAAERQIILAQLSGTLTDDQLRAMELARVQANDAYRQQIDYLRGIEHWTGVIAALSPKPPDTLPQPLPGPGLPPLPPFTPRPPDILPQPLPGPGLSLTLLTASSAETMTELRAVNAELQATVAVLQAGFSQLLASVSDLGVKMDQNTAVTRRTGDAVALAV